jgi:hypothetical protein
MKISEKALRGSCGKTVRRDRERRRKSEVKK